ncbi:hypothetical protein APY04_3110 [Hyphomicrobium sulfonivorans]|uniref:OmpA-like domain-containing protein n=1 Tax=Hyphomicrobium sulfonivorans TaxID=121290 RepID=A0A120CTL7_HYPSL|nr:OmpA family protein [Hyphomicrobium sulfonivorans]KWT64870.1 hypothetical protein APY04_3110 [Hyphomicrobium sulfonivorans]
MRCHPARWLWGLIPVAMLSWLAIHVETDAIEAELEQRSAAALARSGHGWASVAFSGRDGLLVGFADNQQQVDTAANIVRDLWGVRMVNVRARLPETGRIPAFVGDDALPVPKEPDDGPQLLADEYPVAALGSDEPSETLAAGVAGSMTVTAFSGFPIETVREQAPGRSAWQAVATWAGYPDGDVGAVAEIPELLADRKAPRSVRARTVAIYDIRSGAEEAETEPPAPELKGPPVPVMRLTARMPEAEAWAFGPAVPVLEPGETVMAWDADEPEPEPEIAALEPEPEPEPEPQIEVAPRPEPKPKPVRRVERPAAEPTAPRFDTAALPQSNSDPNAGCILGVLEAAERVEVHFAHGVARLDRIEKSILDQLVDALLGCPYASLRISGHADSTGRPRSNLALSKRRARAVVAYMVDRGIDAERLTAVGFGDTQPVAPNTTWTNRAKNRRVEVIVMVRRTAAGARG